MKIIVLCPHFAPDTAPTGTVMTGIVEGLVGRGHEIHVVTSLPWYRNSRGVAIRAVPYRWQAMGFTISAVPFFHREMFSKKQL